MRASSEAISSGTRAHGTCSARAATGTTATSSATAAGRPGAADLLQEALALVARLGAPPIPATIRGRLERIQGAGPLAYGAWVSGRHEARRDGYKLYVEVPERGAPEADWLARDLLGHSGPHRRHAVRMVGVDLEAGRTELYFRAEGAWREDLLRARGGAPVEEALAGLLQGGPPPTVSGFSFALDRGLRLEAFSLFASAHALFGTDAEARRRLLDWSEARGEPLETYAALSAPLAHRTHGPCLHGMVSLVLAGGAALQARLGLSPPEGE